MNWRNCTDAKEYVCYECDNTRLPQNHLFTTTFVILDPMLSCDFQNNSVEHGMWMFSHLLSIYADHNFAFDIIILVVAVLIAAN